MTGKWSDIGDYAIIGDCMSAALISRRGSLDWLCWPRFDSGAVFCGLLDPEAGGSWSIMPSTDFESSRSYIAETNVLETRFTTGTGIVELHDFMAISDAAFRRKRLVPDHNVTRLLRCVSGAMDISVRFSPRPHFGSNKVTIRDRGKLGLRISTGHGMLALHSRVSFSINGADAGAQFSMSAGGEIEFVLTYSEASPEVLPILSESRAAMKRTAQWWAEWSAKNTYKGPHRDSVVRSALTLKLLEFPASGAFVAAATTSLPEKIGGEKNWDYRYCWLRDASLTIEALCGTGYEVEAKAFAEWLLHATRRTQPELMPVYDVYGNLAPREKVLNNLGGYKRSSPVQTGNGARHQFQLDTYGEVIAGAAMLLRRHGCAADRDTSRTLVGFGQYVCDHWQEADAGIWEARGKQLIHTHSRLLCWRALEDLLSLHECKLIQVKQAELFERTRAAIRESIESECWNSEANTYVSVPGTRVLDATLLRMSIHDFDDAGSEKMRATCVAVKRELGAGGSLLYRNLPDDGQPIEAAFGICGFWLVQVLAEGGGTLAEAESAFESLLLTGNDLGLFGEEFDPKTKQIIGNFPQAFTHVGLIIAAIAIERRRARERGAA